MAVYTVHEPPLKRYQPSAAPERFAFVRDGFSFWAFLLQPLWMLRHRQWLVLIGYAVLVGAAAFALHKLGASITVKIVVGFLLALLIGFEAGTLRRFTLGRRGWNNVGVVVGDDRDVAERRFFDAWANGESGTETAPPPSSTPRPGRAPANPAPDVVGLFPESGAPR